MLQLSLHYISRTKSKMTNDLEPRRAHYEKHAHDLMPTRMLCKQKQPNIIEKHFSTSRFITAKGIASSDWL